MYTESISGSVKIEGSIKQPSQELVKRLVEEYSRDYRENSWFISPEITDLLVTGRVEALTILLTRLKQNNLIRAVRMGKPHGEVIRMNPLDLPVLGENALREVFAFYEAALAGMYDAYLAGNRMGDYRFFLGESVVFEKFLKALEQPNAVSKIADFTQARFGANSILREKRVFLN